MSKRINVMIDEDTWRFLGTADTRYINRVKEPRSVIALSEWQVPRPPPSRPRKTRSIS